MQTREIMQRAAEAVRNELPTGVGFALLVWDPAAGPAANYIGNASREDAVQVAATFVERHRQNRIVDTPTGN